MYRTTGQESGIHSV